MNSLQDVPVSHVYDLDAARIAWDERDESFDDSFLCERYSQLHKDIQKVLSYEKFKEHGKNLKIALAALRPLSDEVATYLDINAQVEGDNKALEINQEIVRASACKKTAAWFLGLESANLYLHPIECRKQWCPVCGGKGGTIHKTRKHAIMKRVDFEKYDIRQFVFTVPDSIWNALASRNQLNSLLKTAKTVVTRYFGVPVFNDKGHIKKYRMDKGMIGYLHVFGDPERKGGKEVYNGIFKPHVNVHVFERKGTTLKITKEMIEAIKDSWKKGLLRMGHCVENVDFHYQYRNKLKQKYHAVKYMCRPWSNFDLEAVEDENIKYLLVKSMKGFQYLRFWGALANSVYKDEMDLEDIKIELESKINERIAFLYVAPFSLSGWRNKIEEIDENFYIYRVNERIDKWAENQTERESA
jgi:hypothetical protein